MFQLGVEQTLRDLVDTLISVEYIKLFTGRTAGYANYAHGGTKIKIKKYISNN